MWETVIPRSQRTLFARLGAPFALLLAALIAAPVAFAQISVPGLATQPAASPAEEEATNVAEALRLLAIVLESPEARAALVNELRVAEQAIPAAPAGATGPEPAPAGAAGEEMTETIPELIVEQAVETANDAYASIVELLGALVDVRTVIRAPNLDWPALGRVLLSAATVMLVTVAVLLTARLGAQPMLGRLELRTAAAGFGGRVLWRALAAVLDGATVLVAWLAGIAFAASTGSADINAAQAHFLQAFIATELIRVAIHLIFRPRTPAMRFVIMPDKLAIHLEFWVARIIGLLGYGLLFAVPVVRDYATAAFADWLQLLIVVVAAVMAITVILRNRRPVKKALLKKVSQLPEDAIASGLALLARAWHLIALGYIAGLFVVWRTSRGDAAQEMVVATGWSALAVLVGSILVAMLTRQFADGVQLSERRRRRLPLLEQRLNRLVPAMVTVLRFAVVAIVAAAILSVWGIVDFTAWARSDAGWPIVRGLAWAGAILLGAWVAWLIVASWVEYRLNRQTGGPPTARERTLLALFSNAFVIVLLLVTLFAVLRELGINVAPLIAGAGVAGLAIGFGAQKLVQDIINGAFIQFENTMNEGDIVTAGPVTGVVEKLTIRSVSLRDLSGVVHMIPFSSVDTVSNFTKTFSFYVADIRVAYRENVAEAKDAMQEAFDRLMETENRVHILPPFEMFGVDALTENAVIVRGRIKTLPGQQWATGRAYNEIVKAVFDERGIEIPFPHRTLYMGEDRAGNAPALGLRHLGAGEPLAAKGDEGSP